MCILYTNVTLATHYNEFHVAKQPHIIFLSCDIFIDTSHNPHQNERNDQHFHFVRWRETSGQTGLSSMDSLMGTIMGQVLIRYAMSSILKKPALLPQVSEISDDNADLMMTCTHTHKHTLN